jgi:hypothetical protein
MKALQVQVLPHPQIATLRGEGSFAGNNPTAKRCGSSLTLWRSSETTLNPETDLAATGRATDKYQSSSDDAERSAEPKRLTRCGLTAYPGANQNYKDMVRNPQREILAYLLAGGRLTVQKASRLFETTELRKIVSRLRRLGQPTRTSSTTTLPVRDDVFSSRNTS